MKKFISSGFGAVLLLALYALPSLAQQVKRTQFDVTNGAAVIFGPAARPLPQLPITVDAEGYLVATSDFHEPVGPTYWEREQHVLNNNA